MSLLELAEITKSFGRVRVADALTIEVDAGAAVGIVGPNGAGKTSLFSIISGDLAPDSGRVTFDGRVVTSLDAAARCRLGMGRTYQVPRPFEHMTVFENVLVAAVQRHPGAADLAMRALADTGLTDVANRPAGRLTLLARKRLELARALATQPRLLLLDEVAGGLTDPEVDDLVAIVRAQRERGLTVIWIEHVVHALTRSVDRLICLAGGSVVADGRPDEVLASAVVREVYLGVDVE
jgi:branched-chain amino acid transport system ATP-binding protein